MEMFNACVRGPLRDAVLDRIGSELHMSYSLALAAQLPMLLYGLVDTISCSGHDCQDLARSAGLSSGVEYMELGLLYDLLSSLVVFPAAQPLLFGFLSKLSAISDRPWLNVLLGLILSFFLYTYIFLCASLCPSLAIVPHPEHVFAPCQLQTMGDKDASFQDDDGQAITQPVRMMPEMPKVFDAQLLGAPRVRQYSARPANPEIPNIFSEGVDDICTLEEVNQAALLHTVRVRYSKTQVYTRVARIMIAVNPFQSLPIYASNYLQRYAVGLDAVAGLRRGDGKNQAVLISGESGAGKTESTKLVLSFISEAFSGGSSGAGIQDGSVLGGSRMVETDKIMQTNPVLESFGNAMTVRNNNSSRFGKWLQMTVSSSLAVESCTVTDYLLELTRVCSQGSKERNYHIFFQLIEARNSFNDYAYLRGCLPKAPGIDDARFFEELREAFQGLGIDSNAQLEVFSIVAAILMMGNVEFTEAGEAAALKDEAAVAKASDLLGVDVEVAFRVVCYARFEEYLHLIAAGEGYIHMAFSGKTVAVQGSLDEKVGSFRLRAQRALEVGKGRLVDSSGRILEASATIKDSNVQNGDSLTLQVSQSQVLACQLAFAAILGDGSVVTWGASSTGGDCGGVNDQLQNVEQIQTTRVAFAAILLNGSVVTWGDSASGGDSSAVQEQLKDVQQIQASGGAFAAILGDGTVVTWGDLRAGGDSHDVQHQLNNIQATDFAFAAILVDGSVVTWGYSRGGGNSIAVHIRASKAAFAAILASGCVVTWGDVACGGGTALLQHQLNKVQQIQVCHARIFGDAFTAILGDGSVVTWGDSASGGDSSAVQEQLKDVQQIQASGGAFAAILGDGTVVTWGDLRAGGDNHDVQHQLKNVRQIQASDAAFCAVLDDGSVVTWGDARFGGDSSDVQSQLKNVRQIQAADSAFAAILDSGRVALKPALLKRLIKVGRDVTQANRTATQAKAAADAVARLLYGRLFKWLIKRINSCLSEGKKATGQFFGVLDIAGFESFEHNSLEQLFINLSNEHLQQHFNNHIFKMELDLRLYLQPWCGGILTRMHSDDYKAEGISVDAGLSFNDNSDIVTLIDSKGGILSVLDEEVSMPKATDQTFISKVFKAHEKHARLIVPKISGGGKFGIRHFAGDFAMLHLRLGLLGILSELVSAADRAAFQQAQNGTYGYRMADFEGFVQRELGSRLQGDVQETVLSHPVFEGTIAEDPLPITESEALESGVQALWSETECEIVICMEKCYIAGAKFWFQKFQNIFATPANCP
eukprot:s1581_g5.t1